MRNTLRGRRYAEPATPPPDTELHRTSAAARLWRTVSPALVGATAAITLLGSATIVPSFATARPGEESTAPAASSAGLPAASLSDLAASRQESLEIESGEVLDAQEQQLLASHHERARLAASAVKAEITRLRNLSTFLWPTEGEVSSGFGLRVHPVLGYRRLHNGADIGGACNNPIYAAQSGVVVKTSTGYSGGSGNNVRIDHGSIEGNIIQTAYLHMARFVVRTGQRVNKGDLVGYVGSTGLSTACHLHLTLYKNGAGSDPLEYVKK